MRLKICGIFRLCDTEIINEILPDYAGFVFYPKSHRYIDDTFAVKLRKNTDQKVKTVGVFVDDDPEHIVNLYKDRAINIVQLHGHEDEQYINRLKLLIPDAKIWKAFVVQGENDLISAQGSSADKIILDNGYGTGKRFDWSLLRNVGRDFILAGGLTPDNIAEAANRFKPWALDISSGVETNGVKDKEKIAAAAAAIKLIRK